MSDPNKWNRQVIEEFRANGGKVNSYFEGVTLLLLHTTGARSGLQRVNPVATIQDGEKYVIMASTLGRPVNPDWYYNIVANPEVSAEVGTEQFQALATIAEEPERTQLYEKMATLNPGFAEYQRKTTRIIPVIILTRVP